MLFIELMVQRYILNMRIATYYVFYLDKFSVTIYFK